MKNFFALSICLGLSGSVFASDPKNEDGFAKAQESGHELLSPEKSDYSGVVAETMNAAGYTYIKLKTKTDSIWAATRETKVKKGDYVVVESAFPMHDFHSKSLNRTFDVIYFASDLKQSSAHPKL